MFRSLRSRLAWRELRSDARRTWLLLLLIGLPVAVASGFMTVMLSVSPSGHDRQVGAMGQAAAVLRVLDGADGTCEQVAASSPRCRDAMFDGPAPGFTPRPLSDAGLPGTPEASTSKPVQINGLTAEATVVSLDVGSPIFAGRWTQATPPQADEVLAVPNYLDLMGAEVGDTITVDGKAVRISGTIRMSPVAMSGDLWPQLVVGSGHPMASGDVVRRYLTEVPGAAALKQLNRQGLGIQLPDPYGYDEVSWTLGLALAIVQVGLCLVLGSVFASVFLIIMQRRQRAFALLRATGAGGRTVRSIVWRTALTFGVLGAVVGVLAGMAIMALASTFGSWWVYDYRVPWVQSGLYIVLAVVVIMGFSWGRCSA